jgi:hypothetical protein
MSHFQILILPSDRTLNYPPISLISKKTIRTPKHPHTPTGWILLFPSPASLLPYRAGWTPLGEVGREERKREPEERVVGRVREVATSTAEGQRQKSFGSVATWRRLKGGSRERPRWRLRRGRAGGGEQQRSIRFCAAGSLAAARLPACVLFGI